MEKKNPFITTVGFKKDDPEHVYVAEFLNSMGRGKAQYIVKAVLVYQDLQKKGELTQTARVPYDYEEIKRIVLQIIAEWENGDKEAQEEIFQMYRPFIIKNSMDANIFDEDLYQELSATLIKCIFKFQI